MPELTERQIKYRAYYKANRERELLRKAKKTSLCFVVRDILNIWEKQGIPEDQWGVYEAGCKAIGRIPRICFKVMKK